MTIKRVATGLQIASAKAFNRILVAPKRRRQWARANAPFHFTSVDGYKFELYPPEHIDSEIYQFGIYEKLFLDFLLSRVRQGSVALDIGANIGNHSIYLTSRFAAVHAFEPNPVTFARLSHNVALNSLESTVIPHNVGLGEEAGFFDFRENVAGNLGASGFLQDGETIGPGERKVTLPIMQADAYIDKLDLSRLDFVKVDVEGWEASVFRGLVNTLKKHRPVVAFEYHGAVQPISDFEAIQATLPGYIFAEPEFAPYNVSYVQKALWAIRRGGTPTLARVTAPAARSYNHLLAFPSEEVATRYERLD